MRFYQQTLNILKNFSKINQSILVKSGSVLETLSVSKYVIAEAKVNEVFPREFAFYDLKQFLGIMNREQWKNADIEFGEEFMTLTNAKGGAITYYYADPQVFVHPSKKIKMPTPDVTLQCYEQTLVEIAEMANELSSPDLKLENDTKTVRWECYDKKNATTNRFTITVGEGTEIPYCFTLKQERINKLYPGNYECKISKVGITQWTHETLPLTYWIAVDPDSWYGKEADQKLIEDEEFRKANVRSK